MIQALKPRGSDYRVRTQCRNVHLVNGTYYACLKIVLGHEGNCEFLV
jgi:hypothetical protein